MVSLVETWGSIDQIVTIAKLSHRGIVKATEQNLLFLQKILGKGHTSVLEFAGATFLVTTPIYVARQWMRHRMFSYLEISRRYVEVGEDYIPEQFNDIYKQQLQQYRFLIQKGYRKEQARGILGTGFLTDFYVSGNLRSWKNFLDLRLAKDAQEEIREEAEQIRVVLNEKFPIFGKE